MTGQAEDIGVDAEKMREALVGRWMFIHDLNMKKHKEDVSAAFRRRTN